jgi:glycosyltransferase involved in cell wall biosynthesis
VSAPVVLVASSVHQADDPRVRERTVGVLARRWPVRYATAPPAPSRRDDHRWVALEGGRGARMRTVLREALRPDVALLSVHDPELVPVGLVAHALRGVPLVVDVHEDVPGQVLTKEHVPAPLRRPAAWASLRVLRAAERRGTVTLAEAGYQRRFTRPHPVLPNYPLVEDLPPPAPADGSLVYVGDVTAIRGAFLAVDAVAGMAAPPPLRMVGRCFEPLRSRLLAHARERGVELELPGFLPHREAMAVAAQAGAGLSPLLDVPNYRHSLPTKTLEYLALGVPVVASDLPGTAAVIADKPGVQLVPPGDAAAWTAALEAALAGGEQRRAARAAAPAVRARYRWPSERLLAVYADALRG